MVGIGISKSTCSDYLRKELSNNRSKVVSLKPNRQGPKILFIDIELNDAKGISHKLSSLTGKPVIIDFSVFESSSNIAYTFELRDIYNKYSPQGLQIYQISLDRNKMLWQKSVANLPWICVRDESGKTATVYNVQSVPTLFLIDRQGNIMGRYEDIRQLAADISRAF